MENEQVVRRSAFLFTSSRQVYPISITSIVRPKCHDLILVRVANFAQRLYDRIPSSRRAYSIIITAYPKQEVSRWNIVVQLCLI